ncbi:hypothetical protein [Paenibacillus sp. 481]|uniref:hypothetical protein n=1 Tax=Paenibacillus sp. 481 TaxID=2835869 RepID=UPI001E3E5443|nr:hypothetical protein [Paenibacillus sp. 481]UHA75420.1 hypothetical protein KIK04_10695 [Paenibacillus sp. 481]
MQKVSTPLPEKSVEHDLAKCKIDHIETYLYDTKRIESGVIGIIDKSMCGLMVISSRNMSGFAEYFIPIENRHFDLVQWAKVFMKLKGVSIPVALDIVEEKDKLGGPIRTNLAKASLMDLASKLRNPAMQREGNTHISWLDRAVLFDYSQAYFSC